MNFKMAMLSIFATALLFSCKSSDEPNDKVNEVIKNGAVESSITTKHVNDSIDVLVTTHKVWKNNALIKTLEKFDTVPSLGDTTVQDDNNVNKTIKKDYEVYITVK